MRAPALPPFLKTPLLFFRLVPGLALLLAACSGGGGGGGSQTSSPPPPVTPPPVTPPARVYGAEYYVSPNGSDNNPGTSGAPFKSLEKARDTVRAKIATGMPSGGIAVWLKGGVYERTATLELNAQDSGSSATATVDWRAVPGETVRIIGGHRLPAGSFTPVTSTSPVWGRLDAAARGHILQINVDSWLGLTSRSTADERQAAYGVQKPSDVTWLDTRLDAALELFVDGEPMQLGRWPDAGVSDGKQDVNDDQVQVFGSGTPAVGGVYKKDGVVDGVSLFKRDGLVDYSFVDTSGNVVNEQLQYYLYRYTWDYNGTHNVAWFLTTKTGGYPADKAPAMRPWWFVYRADGGFDNLAPYSPSGAKGTLLMKDPAKGFDGFAFIASVPTDASGETRFAYYGDRPSRWTAATDIWFHGYFRWLYYDQHRSGTVDTATRTITLAKAPGFGIEAMRPWYAYNLLEEITQPGEWYLDRGSGILYLWPPASFGGASDIVISRLETPLFQTTKASHIRFIGFTAEGTRKTLIAVNGGSGVTLSELRLRNNGGVGAELTGNNHRASRCSIRNTGLKAVYLNGGDRPSLTRGELVVENCDIARFGRAGFCYQAAVQIVGCGNTARHNLIGEAHHSAILWDGNEHLIEFNEIFDVCRTTSDAGVIYAGNDWGGRGTVIRHNYIHDIDSSLGTWVHGVYLDDCLSGVRVEGNIITDVIGNAIMHGGGRDHVLVNNILVRCRRGLYADARGVTWNLPTSPNKGSWEALLKKLVTLGYQKEPWLSRYPECAAIPNDWATILSEQHWLRPEGCRFTGNAGWKNSGWIDGEIEVLTRDSSGNVVTRILATDRYAQISGNLADTDPMFVDEAGGDLRLNAGSPVHQIPGWQDIPFGSIGIEP